MQNCSPQTGSWFRLLQSQGTEGWSVRPALHTACTIDLQDLHTARHQGEGQWWSWGWIKQRRLKLLHYHRNQNKGSILAHHGRGGGFCCCGREGGVCCYSSGVCGGGGLERMVSGLFHFLLKWQSCSVCGQDQVIYGMRGFWVHSQVNLSQNHLVTSWDVMFECLSFLFFLCVSCLHLPNHLKP